MAWKILFLSGPILAVRFVVALASNLFQVGFMLVGEPIKPELKKINPLDKAKQMFSMKNIVEFLKSQKVALQYIPERLVVREAMPSTPSGKIQKFKLREQLADGATPVLRHR